MATKQLVMMMTGMKTGMGPNPLPTLRIQSQLMQAALSEETVVLVPHP
uniref:Sorting nexin 9 n=1 Tax=Homo sapiens TaxID=9606 RepID=A0A7P0TBD0_HUMAN